MSSRWGPAVYMRIDQYKLATCGVPKCPSQQLLRTRAPGCAALRCALMSVATTAKDRGPVLCCVVLSSPSQQMPGLSWCVQSVATNAWDVVFCHIIMCRAST